MKLWTQALLVLGLSLSFSSLASADVNVSGDPSFGTHSLETNFDPDPARFRVVAGGSEASRQLGNCDAGFIANTPDIRLNFEAGELPLRFFVDARADTTLAINLPDGSWVCNDDTVGLNPVIDLARPQSGQYDIFVGTADDGESPRVSLQVTELPDEQGPSSERSPRPTPPIRQDGGEATFGTFELEAGFDDDPSSFEVTAGGTRQAATLLTQNGRCDSGWIAQSADIIVNYEAGSHPLRFFVDDRQADTMLAVQLPDGSWLCDDDTVARNPVIDISDPDSGAYKVFVGTMEEDEFPEVRVQVTEMPNEVGPGQSAGHPEPRILQQSENQSPQNEGQYGRLDLEAGFDEDPASLEVTAGGRESAAGTIRTATGARCNAGFISNSADVLIRYEAGEHPLRFFVNDHSQDTTLAIQLPNGSWLCSDDAVGINPVIDLETPTSGTYRVFVGTIQADEFPEVTLHVTELPQANGPSRR